MANLVELFDNIVQMQNLNGVPLAAGKLYVYALGRTRLMDSWSDVDGESLNPNPIILDDAGQAHVYVSDDFDYTLVVCDQYNNEIFSLDKYLYSEGSHSHADVAVAPSEHIGVSSYHVGEVTVYVPYITGNFGKTYEGIDPIVVNNDINKISANNIPLGVQDPLYFVEDSETACIIGCSAQTEIPSALSGKWDNASDTVIANSAQWSENTTYEAGSYVDIDGNTINVTGLQPAGNYQSAGNYVSASELENLQPKGDYYSASNPSGFLINEDITGKLDTTAFSTVSGDFLTAIPSEYVTENTLQSGLSSKLDSTAFSTVSGNFLTAHQSLQGYATEQWVEDKGYITGIDIQESAGWNEATTVVNNNSAIWNNTTNVVSSNSAQWGATNPQIPVTGINGIKISESGDKVVFEVSADYALADDLTGKQDSLTFGYHDTAISSIDNSALYDNSAHARITTLAGRISDLSSNKLDTTAFSDVSGTFLTAHQDLSNYATTAELQTVSGEITALIPTALTGDYVEKSAINTITGDNGEYTWTAITGIDNVWISASEAAYATQALTAATAGWADHALIAEVAEDWKGASGKLDNSASANFYTTANESGFITGVDLTPYQLTADMTAYQPAGDYLTTADSAQFYTIDNPSGFITEVPESALSGFIPYSASGIELPNSNFKIDVSGQAYKVISYNETETITGNYGGDYETWFPLSSLERRVYSSTLPPGDFDCGTFMVYPNHGGNEYEIPLNGIVDLTKIQQENWDTSTILSINAANRAEAILSYSDTNNAEIPYLLSGQGITYTTGSI